MNKEIHLLIAIAILFILYVIVKKIYTWWIKVGIYIFRGLKLWYKYKEKGESIFKGLYKWYIQREVYCRKCNGNGVLSECCGALINIMQHPNKKYTRISQCNECGAICNPISCECRN